MPRRYDRYLFKQVQRSVDAALATVEHVERLMSFHDPQSELSRVNREAGRG